MIKLIIFDLDGTLLDTREDIADACNYALRMCGHPERDLTEYNRAWNIQSFPRCPASGKP